MIYYSIASGHGRPLLADVLGAEDPFSLPPADIVERVFAAGFTPVVDQPQTTPFRQLGCVTEVLREDQTFIVAVSRDAQEISVQEARADAYEDE